MKKPVNYFFKIVILAIVWLPIIVYSLEIPNIYIESQGNNKFEAKIKANKSGIRQSIKLFLDKINVSDFDINEVNLPDLKHVCQITNVEDEKSSDRYYSARVSYYCNEEVLKQVMPNYADTNAIGNFYNTLVVPVLRKGNQYVLWDDTNTWYQGWLKYKKPLAESKILLAEPNSKVTSQNINKLNYQEIAKYYPLNIFTNVTVAICDFFEKNNTTSYVRVKYKVLDRNGDKVDIQEYEDLELKRKDLSVAFDEIITEFIDLYGSSTVFYDIGPLTTELENSINGINRDRKGSEEKRYTLYMSGYDNEYVQNIKDAISSIPQVKSFDYNPEGIGLWKVELSGNFKDDEDFAECLYMKGLTYRVSHDGQMNLIKLDAGV